LLLDSRSEPLRPTPLTIEYPAPSMAGPLGLALNRPALVPVSLPAVAAAHDGSTGSGRKCSNVRPRHRYRADGWLPLAQTNASRP